MGSTQMSRVLNEPGQKSTRIEICKKISTQPDPKTWRAGLAHGFQPILTALLLAFAVVENECKETWKWFLTLIL